MAMNKEDAVFLKHFAQLIATLVCVTLVLGFVAHWIYSGAPHAVNEKAASEVQSRLAPMGAVYSGATGQAAKAAAEEAARLAAAAQVAYDGTLDGSVIYGRLCTACHGSGAGGAPKLEKALWAERLKQGTDTLIKHATEGYKGTAGQMPARGGNPALNDAQVKATVEWMLQNIR